MSILNTLKIEADVPETFGNSGTQYRRNCRTLSGEQGVKTVMRELTAFVPDTVAAIKEGKRLNDNISQSAMCTTAIAHGLVSDLKTLKKVCPRLDKNHVRYIAESAGLHVAFLAKATAPVIAALKAAGHYGANNGLKVGQPVFFLDDVTALVKPAKVVAAKKPVKTAAKEVKPTVK